MPGHDAGLTDELVRLRDWAESAPLSEVTWALVVLDGVARQRRAREAAEAVRRATAGGRPAVRIVAEDDGEPDPWSGPEFGDPVG